MAGPRRSIALLAPALFVCACATGTSVDAGGTSDAQIGQPDSSLPTIDAATNPPDASVPHPDASVPHPDANVPPADAPSGGTEITITQSSSQTITDLNSVSCNNSVDGHSDNSYYRVFTLSDDEITSQFDVTSVEIGIETASSGTGGQQPATVYLYTLSGAVSTANLTQIGSAAVSVADQTLSKINVNVTGTVPAGGTLVVEFFTPDGQTDGHFLFVGSNTAAESGLTYIRATDCSVTDMTPTADIGYPDMHWVLNVTGLHYP